MSVSLGRIGSLDFSDWFYGLAAAFIGGGSNAVVAAFSLIITDPSHFNFQQPNFYRIVGTIFATSGLVNALMFLRTKPLPALKTTVVTTETTDTTTPKVKQVQTVQETTTTPVAPKEPPA